MANKQTICMLPMRCERCNAVFDLWYDLQQQEEINKESFALGWQVKVEQSLCWRCRNEREEDSILEEETFSEDDYELALELE